MEMVNKGRKMVISLITIALLIDIITIVSSSLIYVTIDRMDLTYSQLLRGTFRLLVSGIIFFFLYKGHRWAKWLIVVLFIVSGLLTFLSLILFINLLILVLGIIHIFLGIMLILSKNINYFLKYQKGIYNPNFDENNDNLYKEI